MKTMLLALALLLAPLSVTALAAPDAGTSPDMSMKAMVTMSAAPAAPTAKPDVSNPVETIGEAVKDAQAKNWIALASLILMAAAFYARKYAPELSFFHTFAGGLVLCLAAGLMSAVGEAIYGGKFNLNALLAGLAATASAAFAIAHPTPKPAKS